MNSYPPELLVQLAPVMFVAGLDSPPHTQSSSPTSRPDEFASLISRLRVALQNQRKVAVWQSEKTKTFQVVLVDKEVRFPPRKSLPPEDPQYSSAHSPLSPLTPTSPLHPDGLIAPIWIRKHTTLVPSVFVLFLRIYEHPSLDRNSPSEDLDAAGQREKEQEEKRRDMELATEVAIRKKGTGAHAIKLTVVLMSSRKMLDDPTLDARLTFIRRQSGLDSRAALFVLSPVSSSELGEFVISLQQALYDPALEYYTNHSKRVRRKRNRYSQSPSYPTTMTIGVTSVARSLRPEGWTVRYEYKMACFAEFRGEDEVALKHYQDAYSALMVMFGSIVMLPPRTKRWAEAKVLVDCINVKISKLYLYNNEHSLAFSQYNTHIRMFSDFSRGWGIGEENFEYWSWIARQHRLLAELLEQGIQSTLLIPIHKPAHLSTSSQRVGTMAAGPDVESLRLLGLNPSHALQHPGFYYYMAARCTEMRQEKFLAVLELERQPHKPVLLTPGFANEKKVDHSTIILELYTKAYELFKKYTTINFQSSVQGRLTLWIAYRIAHTYFNSGKFDMSMRFFERIAKSYRREQWNSLLQPLLDTWQACAHEIGDDELRIKLLIESLSHDVSKSDPSDSLQNEILNILKNPTPSDSDVIAVDLSEAQAVFDTNVVFWAPETNVGKHVPFQISFVAPYHISLDSLPFSSLSIHLSHVEHPVIVRHADLGSPAPQTQYINLGHISYSEPSEVVRAYLRWPSGGSLIFAGTTSSDLPTTLKVSKLVLTMSEGSWNVELLMNPCSRRRGRLALSQWLSSIDPPKFLPVRRDQSSSTIVRHRPHNFLISFDHHSPAFLQEKYPIDISITNDDDRDLNIVADVLLPPTEIEDISNTIKFGGEESTHFIKGVSFGILHPAETVTKTLYLLSTGVAGDRILDISVQSQRISIATTHVDEYGPEDVTETLRTITIPIVDPFEIAQTVEYTQDLEDLAGLANLRTFSESDWSSRTGRQALVKTSITCVGPSTLMLEGIRMERYPGSAAKIVECSTDDLDNTSPIESRPGDVYIHLSQIIIPSTEDTNEGQIRNAGAYHVDWRRFLGDGQQGDLSRTVIPLPPLHLPVDELIALLSLPSAARLHSPLSLFLTVRNLHALRSANVSVQLVPEPTDSFIVAGLRNGRLPLLLPRTEETLTWRLTPTKCGHVRVPQIKVINHRAPFTGGNADGEPGLKGEDIKVVEVWLDQRVQVDSPPRERASTFTLATMPRRARIHFVSLRSSLVNLPISIYGPLVERSVRPQNLAIHLTVLASSQPNTSKIEACVGWTGLASASSLAHFDVSSPGEKGLETIEIDPQYAQGLGLNQGDTVEIGLLHDLPFANSVTTEPLTSDDWEIIEIHSSHVESTLLSQVRVARIDQELDVWIMNRTRVRLRVTNLDPASRGNTLLLTNNTEVSIAPKPHRTSAHKDVPDGKGQTANTQSERLDGGKSSLQSWKARTLRVLPSRFALYSLPAYQGIEVVAYVSPQVLSELYRPPIQKPFTCYKVAIKRLAPPVDPSSQSSSREGVPTDSQTTEPSAAVHGSEREESKEVHIYVGALPGLPYGHVVFPAVPEGSEEWDLVSLSALPDSNSTVHVLPPTESSSPPAPTFTAHALAGVDGILERCTNFCVRNFLIHATTEVVYAVTSLLVTGRKGAGKTSIVQAVATSVQEDSRIRAYTHYIDVSRYSERPVGSIKSLFRYWFDKASWHRPSILILDNLDALLSPELEHADSFRSRHLTELFLSIYAASARSTPPNARGIILLATATSTASLHHLVNASHLFKDVVNVQPPDKNARKDILSLLVKNRMAMANDIQEDPASPMNPTTVATQTEGYSATDLRDLVERAVHQVAIRASIKNTPALLSAADFTTAQIDFVPLSLRDVNLQKSGVAWSDIGGLHEARRILRETLEWPTKYAQIFAQSPLRLRSGLLLYGFPGCGKTLLASAVAKECGLNFISVKGPEVLNKYIGASEKTVRDLFERASAAKPCVLFFDEFDSIAPKRGHDSTGVTDRVVNQLLTQMDGAEGLDGVYVLAATSRPDLIDSALLRPGRLDKSLFCNMPNVEERKDILSTVSTKVALSSSVDLSEVAKVTEGYSGADLQALLYNAHLEVIHASISKLPNTMQAHDEGEPIEFSTFGGSTRNRVVTKAEQMILQQRLRKIRSVSRPGKIVTGLMTPSTEKNDITMDHIRQVLKTMRPSVSTEEHARLDKIYRAFLSDRDGPLPVPPEGGTVGSRISLG